MERPVTTFLLSAFAAAALAIVVSDYWRNRE
jgi:hypothetical protein